MLCCHPGIILNYSGAANLASKCMLALCITRDTKLFKLVARKSHDVDIDQMQSDEDESQVTYFIPLTYRLAWLDTDVEAPSRVRHMHGSYSRSRPTQGQA